MITHTPVYSREKVDTQAPASSVPPIATKEPPFGERLYYRQKQFAKELQEREQPFDVAWAAKLAACINIATAVVVLEYAKFRSIINASCAGLCSKKVRQERGKLCNETCTWFSDGWCRGCDCPRYFGSKLRVKLRLARFKCPQKKFGRAKGWIGRLKMLLSPFD